MSVPIAQETRQRLLAWWNNEGYDRRPCILARLEPPEPAREERGYTDDQFWRDPVLMARVRADRMRSTTWLGESVPFLYMDYGANAMALQMGAVGH